MLAAGLPVGGRFAAGLAVALILTVVCILAGITLKPCPNLSQKPHPDRLAARLRTSVLTAALVPTVSVQLIAVGQMILRRIKASGTPACS
jgi:hypothetical protein